MGVCDFVCMVCVYVCALVCASGQMHAHRFLRVAWFSALGHQPLLFLMLHIQADGCVCVCVCVPV